MTKRADWPGRGGTWLGVPALLLVVVGGLVLIDILDRQSLGQNLLATGIETVAESVEVDVVPNKGTPIVDGVRGSFRTADGRLVRFQLVDYEDDAEGMQEGVQEPVAGSRYAPPLSIRYLPERPHEVLAVVDARQWTADRDTPRIGKGLIATGILGVLAAIALQIRDARRRGVAWWQWYSDPPGGRR